MLNTKRWVEPGEPSHDPVLALLADQLEPKRSDCAPPAGKSTLRRLEHTPLRRGDQYHEFSHDPQVLAICSLTFSSRPTRGRPAPLFSSSAAVEPITGPTQARIDDALCILLPV